MNLQEFYLSVGGNYNTILARIPSDSLIEKFLFKFVEDPTYNNLLEAQASSNIDAAFRAAHTLKGVAYNLDLNILGDAASTYTELLRGASIFPNPDAAKAISAAYQLTIQSINKLKR